jgi:hypothetical protein
MNYFDHFGRQMMTKMKKIHPLTLSGSICAKHRTVLAVCRRLLGRPTTMAMNEVDRRQLAVFPVSDEASVQLLNRQNLVDVDGRSGAKLPGRTDRRTVEFHWWPQRHASAALIDATFHAVVRNSAHFLRPLTTKTMDQLPARILRYLLSTPPFHRCLYFLTTTMTTNVVVVVL